ncbi:MAG: PTS sugar transporter subunit IIA [Candidatus Riflebacteria bacterium]|nr:PTS sugar transporter subunit IIA [Candidatus Riflebacteria bacterium]
MELTLHEVVRLLNVSEKQIHQWVDSEEIPVYRVQDRLIFNRDEVIDWAAVKHLNTTLEKLEDNISPVKPKPIFVNALRRGGVLHDVKGNDRREVLKEISILLPMPPDCDRDLVFQMFIAREIANSTGVGDGIALPHVQNPMILHVPESQVTIAFLKKPVDFDAPDKKPVFCLFNIISTSVKEHIQMLSHIANVLRNNEFMATLREKGPFEKIVRMAEMAEIS